MSTYWLTGWGMPSRLAPRYDRDGLPLVPLAAWPGYEDALTHEQLSELWNTDSLVLWLHKQIISHRENNNQPTRLVAWSMGGLLALLYVHRFPNQIEHLELWGTSPCFVSIEQEWEGQSKEAINQLKTSILGGEIKEVDRFVKSQIPADIQSRALRLAFYKSYHQFTALRPISTQALLCSLDWLVSTDIRWLLPEITTQTTIHHGDLDIINSYESGCYLASNLPCATWKVHHGKGHAAWFEG